MDSNRESDMAKVEEVEWTSARLADEYNVKPRVVNVVGHGRLRSTVDCKRLALLVRNADYTPRSFGALILRFRSPKASISVYKSGKFLVLGCRQESEAHSAVDKFRSILQKVEFENELDFFSIANVVVSVDLHFNVRLEGLARDHIRFCTYEPELFPGLIYRMMKPKCTFLIFVSGKMILTGLQKTEQADEALCALYPALRQYRMDPPIDSSSDDE